MRKLFSAFVLYSIISGSLFASEIETDVNRPVLSQYSTSSYPLTSYENVDQDETKKTFPFLNLGVVPRLGVSIRKGTTATDVSICPLVIANVLFFSKSQMFYKNPSYKGIYWSCGVGALIGHALGQPLIGVTAPIRTGYEFENGFIDIGGELTGAFGMGFLILPDLRVGFKF